MSDQKLVQELLFTTIVFSTRMLIRGRKNAYEADLKALPQVPENVHKHVALRAKIQELESILKLVHSSMSIQELVSWAGPKPEPSSPAGESHWPYPKTYDELRAQLLVAADEDTTYEIGAAELLLLLDEGQRESTEAHARLAALLGVDAKDVGLGDLVDMVRPQVVADKDWYKEHYQVEVADV